jgi:hypothetical protein
MGVREQPKRVIDLLQWTFGFQIKQAQLSGGPQIELLDDVQ